MGATFNRVKTWIAEALSASDINAEFNNILDNFTPAGMDDASANTTAMQAQTDPGEVGTESLATSLAEEIERLRYSIAELKGTTYWYTSPVTTLASLNTAFGDGGLPSNRLVSGASSANSSQSILITPEGVGVGDGFTVSGTTTNLVYSVNDTEYTLSSDITVAATNAAPATNNTCLVNDAGFSGQDWTKYVGMLGTAIPIDNIGSEITSLNGKLAGFRLTNAGTESEYFIAQIDTTNGQLIDCKRGWFFDENAAAIPAVTITNNDTITLMNLTWVFLKNDNTIDITYNEPIVSPTQPSSPSSGDYWYDQVNGIWKEFDGSVYNDAASVFLGTTLTDENDYCACARSEDFTKSFINYNNVEVTKLTAATLTTQRDLRVGVYGNVITTRNDDIVWDITSDLDTGTEAASTLYFFYLTETGVPKISKQAPHDFSTSRGGYYHPHETWRCVAQAWNDGSSDLNYVISYHLEDSDANLKGEAVEDPGSSANDSITWRFFTSPLQVFNLYTGEDTNYVTRKFPYYQSFTLDNASILDQGQGYNPRVNVVGHLIYNDKVPALGVSSYQRGVLEAVNTTEAGTASSSYLLYSRAAYTGSYCKGIASISANNSITDWIVYHVKHSRFTNVCQIASYSLAGSTTVQGTNTEVDTAVAYINEYRKTKVYCGGDNGSNNYILCTNGTSSVTTVTTTVCISINSVVKACGQYAVAAGGATSTALRASPASLPVYVIAEGEITAGTCTVGLMANNLYAGGQNTNIDAEIVVEELPFEAGLII